MSAPPTAWTRIEPPASLSLDRRGCAEDGKEFDHAAILVGVGNRGPDIPGHRDRGSARSARTFRKRPCIAMRSANAARRRRRRSRRRPARKKAVRVSFDRLPETGVLDSFVAKPSPARATGGEAGNAWPGLADARAQHRCADAALSGASLLRRPLTNAPSEGLDCSNGSGEYRLRLNSLS